MFVKSVCRSAVAQSAAYPQVGDNLELPVSQPRKVIFTAFSCARHVIGARMINMTSNLLLYHSLHLNHYIKPQVRNVQKTTKRVANLVSHSPIITKQQNYS